MGVRFWNTAAAENAADYPAHHYATAPYEILLRAVDVAAPPAIVYRWLCQLSVAPYSYDWLDNGGRRSPRELTPGAERLAIGQRFMVFRIVDFAPDRHITAASLPRATSLFGPVVVTYQVSATATGSRLIACFDVTTRTWRERVRTGLLAVGDLVMARRQLLNLKTRAEQSAVAA